MTFDPDAFNDEQKRFLSSLVRDFKGPTSTATVLLILERALGELNPDWELDPQAFSEDLRKDIEVCMAAAHYVKVQDLAEAP